jgi:hypothetical protein
MTILEASHPRLPEIYRVKRALRHKKAPAEPGLFYAMESAVP